MVVCVLGSALEVIVRLKCLIHKFPQVKEVKIMIMVNERSLFRRNKSLEYKEKVDIIGS